MYMFFTETEFVYLGQNDLFGKAFCCYGKLLYTTIPPFTRTKPV